MVVRGGGAELVDVGKRRLDGVGDAIEEAPLVERAVGPALAARPVVGHHDHERVVELAGLLEVVEHPAEPVVVVGDVAGEDLGHPGEQALLVVFQRVPRPDGVEQRPRLAVGPGTTRLTVGVDGREHGALGKQAHRDLALEDALPDGLVALVEDALVAVGPLEGHEVRSVTGLRREVHEEGLVGIDDLGIADELDSLVGHVVGQVVAPLGPRRRLDRVVVVHEVRVVRVRLAPEPAVEALEAAPEGPTALVGGEVALLTRGEVPLADAVGVVALGGEDLGDEPALERDAGGDAGVARGELGDRGHAVGGGVSAGEQRRTGRRAQGGGVEVRELHAPCGDAGHVRALHRATEGVHGGEAEVVPRQQQDVRRAWRRLGRQVRLPVRLRVPDVDVDLAVEPRGHLCAPLPWSRSGGGVSRGRGRGRRWRR